MKYVAVNEQVACPTPATFLSMRYTPPRLEGSSDPWGVPHVAGMSLSLLRQDPARVNRGERIILRP